MRSVVVVGADVGGMQNAFHAVVLGRAPAVLRPSSPLTPVRMYGLRRLAMGRMAMNAVAQAMTRRTVRSSVRKRTEQGAKPSMTGPCAFTHRRSRGHQPLDIVPRFHYKSPRSHGVGMQEQESGCTRNALRLDHILS